MDKGPSQTLSKVVFRRVLKLAPQSLLTPKISTAAPQNSSCNAWSFSLSQLPSSVSETTKFTLGLPVTSGTKWNDYLGNQC